MSLTQTSLGSFQWGSLKSYFKPFIPNNNLGMSSGVWISEAVRITFRSPDPILASGGSNKILKMSKISLLFR